MCGSLGSGTCITGTPTSEPRSCRDIAPRLCLAHNRSVPVRLKIILRICGIASLAMFCQAAGQNSSATAPAATRLDVVDAVVHTAIENHEIPGAVVLIGHDGKVIYRKAFGHRALEPAAEA